MTLRTCLKWISVTASLFTASAVAVGDDFALSFDHQVAMDRTGAGSLTVTAELGGVPGTFLLDTGAGMTTISQDYFNEIASVSDVTPLQDMMARLASGKLVPIKVYRIDSFQLGESCNLGPVEVGVMKRGGRNLLGLSALSQGAPFAVALSPPVLGLSRCAASGVAAR